MFGLISWSPARRAGQSTRTFLRVETLEGRAHPSDLTGVPPVPPTTPPAVQGAPPAPVPVPGNETPPVNQPPSIDLIATPIGNGVFVLHGQVTDEHPGGLTVFFTGVTSVQGLSVVTNDDGSFSLTVQLKTDGTDFGNVVATVTDDGGLSANDFDYVMP